MLWEELFLRKVENVRADFNLFGSTEMSICALLTLWRKSDSDVQFKKTKLNLCIMINARF